MNTKKDRSLKVLWLLVETFVLIFVCASATIFGQTIEAVKWVKILNDKQDLSLNFPADLVAVKWDQPFGSRKELYANIDGVSLGFTISTSPNAKEGLDRIQVNEERKPTITGISSGDFTGRYIRYADKGIEHKFYIANGDKYCSISAKSDSDSNMTLKQFLGSIEINGKKVMQVKGLSSIPDAEPLAIKDIGISDIVKQAKKGKASKIGNKVEYLAESQYSPCDEDNSVRQAILILQGPSRTNILSGIDVSDIAELSGAIQYKYTISSTGEITSVQIFSDIKRNILKALTNGSGDLKFLPAAKNGVPVSGCAVIESKFGSSRSVRMYSVH